MRLRTPTDKATLTALAGRHPHPENQSIRVTENYASFKKWVKSGEVDLPTLCKGLAKLVVVDIR